MTEPERITITLSFPAESAARLAALADPSVTYQDQADKITSVLDQLADHAQQGVYRPGTWERPWVCQVFGYDWLANLEPDPDHLDTGWQRPRNRP